MRMWGDRLGFLIVTLTATVAHAGNDDEILVGNEAAMTGGAMTAVVNDGSSLFYNPAGMVGVVDDTIDVSGSAYTLRLYESPGIVENGAGDRGAGSFSEVVIVPSAVAFVRALDNRVRIGLGIFTVKQSDLTLRAELMRPVTTTIPGTTAQERVLLSQTSNTQLMYGTLGVAAAFTPRINFGATISLTYVSVESSTQFGAGTIIVDDTNTPVGAGFVQDSVFFAIQGLGLRGGVGLQWAITEHWRLGVAIQTPSAFFYASTQFDQVQTSASSDAVLGFGTVRDDNDGFGWDWFESFRFRLGLAYRDADRWWISLDVDAQPGITNEGIDVRRNFLVNARLGALYEVSSGWWLGAGAFTDLSPQSKGDDFINFYGGTFGLRYRSDRRLDPEAEEDEDLTFESVFAVRYAYGTGEVTAVRFEPAVNPAEPVQSFFAPIDVHELSLHVGAGLRF